MVGGRRMTLVGLVTALFAPLDRVALDAFDRPDFTGEEVPPAVARPEDEFLVAVAARFAAPPADDARPAELFDEVFEFCE